MRIKYNLFISLFLLISAVFLENNSSVASAKTNYPSKSSSKITKANNSSYSLIINPIESVPIINLQVHKITNSVHAIFCTVNNLAVCLKCYNFFSGNGHKKLAVYQKVLLFPFHTFW